MRGDRKRDEACKVWFFLKKNKKNSVNQTYSQLKLTIAPVTSPITTLRLLCKD